MKTCFSFKLQKQFFNVVAWNLHFYLVLARSFRLESRLPLPQEVMTYFYASCAFCVSWIEIYIVSMIVNVRNKRVKSKAMFECIDVVGLYH